MEVKAICPKCKKQFALACDPISKDLEETVEVHSCVSGGVYGLMINCPHCRASFDIHGQ